MTEHKSKSVNKERIGNRYKISPPVPEPKVLTDEDSRAMYPKGATHRYSKTERENQFKSDCAYYQPQPEALKAQLKATDDAHGDALEEIEKLTQKVKELEESHKHSIAFSHENIVLLENAGWVHENDLKKNGWINRKQHTRSIHEHLAAAAEDSEEAMASLEAENARLKGVIKAWEEKHKEATDKAADEMDALEAQLKPVSKESGLTDQEIIEGVIPYTLRSVNGLQRALVELGWRKALAEPKENKK